MIDVAIPNAGRMMMYTSGWPKIQNRFCHSSASPPPRGIVEVEAELPVELQEDAAATVSGGSANTSANATARNAKQNSGIRLSDIPGARSLKIVTMKLIAAAVRRDAVEDQPEGVEVDVRARACTASRPAARSRTSRRSDAWPTSSADVHEEPRAPGRSSRRARSAAGTPCRARRSSAGPGSSRTRRSTSGSRTGRSS